MRFYAKAGKEHIISIGLMQDETRLEQGDKEMAARERKYKAMISSDWNECLAPTGPFDPVSFHYPGLTSELSVVFKKYTANLIPFKEAVGRIQAILPSPITESRMDAYLEQSFKTYPGVPELIEWCLGKDILFMINTTGAQGFFQRAFFKDLIPQIPVLSASPFIRYARRRSDPRHVYDLFETRDKAKHTEAVMMDKGIAAGKVILIGDSGGDGPHFEWGARAGAHLVGSMTKHSLKSYCDERGIEIDLHFGLSYSPAEPRNPGKEMLVNFMGLSGIIEEILDL